MYTVFSCGNATICVCVHADITQRMEKLAIQTPADPAVESAAQPSAAAAVPSPELQQEQQSSAVVISTEPVAAPEQPQPVVDVVICDTVVSGTEQQNQQTVVVPADVVSSPKLSPTVDLPAEPPAASAQQPSVVIAAAATEQPQEEPPAAHVVVMRKKPAPATAAKPSYRPLTVDASLKMWETPSWKKQLVEKKKQRESLTFGGAKASQSAADEVCASTFTCTYVYAHSSPA